MKQGNFGGGQMIKLKVIKDKLVSLKELKPEDLSQADIKRLKNSFFSEQLERWLPAAKTIGRLAGLGSSELKEFLQEMLITDDNIHRQRHALTAIASYYFYCDDETEKFKFLTEYKDHYYYDSDKKVDLAEITEEKSLKSLLDEIIVSFSEYNQLCELFAKTANLEKEKLELSSSELELLKKVLNNIYHYQSDVIAALSQDLELNKEELTAAQSYFDLVEKIKEIYEIKSFEQTLEFLAKREESYINRLSFFYKLENNLELAIKDGAIKKDLSNLKIRYGLVNSRFPMSWFLGSLSASLAELARKRDDIKAFLQNLIKRGRQEIEHVVNLPLFFLASKDEDNELEFKNFSNEFKKLTKVGIKLISKIDNKFEKVHIAKLLLDLDYFWDEFYSQQFSSLLKDYPELIKEDIVEKYNRIHKLPISERRQKVLELIEEIKEYFVNEIKWDALTKPERNTRIIFSMLLNNANFNLTAKDKRRILLAEINKIKNKNDELLNLFLRELKEFYFVDLQQAKGSDDLSEIATFQIYSVLELIKDWNWRGVINKDLATIVTNVLDVLWAKENYQQVFKLAFLFFNALPETSIVSEIIKYTKAERLTKLVEIYNLEAEQEFNVVDFNDSLVKIKDILEAEGIDSEIIDFYDSLEKLLFKKEIQCKNLSRDCDFFAVLSKKEINLLDANAYIAWENSQLNCGDCQQEKARFKINKLNERDYKLLAKYIFKPNVRYNYYKNKGVLSFLTNSAREEKKEVNRQIEHQTKSYLNDLKGVISSLDVEQDNYFNGFKDSKSFHNLDDVIRRLLSFLKQYYELMNKFPVFERDYILAALEEAEDSILLVKEQIAKIDIDCKAEAEDQLVKRIDNDFAEFNSNNLSNGLKKSYQEVIYDNFLNRAMFTEYNSVLKKKDISTSNNLLASLNTQLTNSYLFVIIFLIPALSYGLYKIFDFFAVEALAQSLQQFSVNLYFNYILAIQAILVIIFFMVVFKLLARLFSSGNNSSSREGYKFTFFLPKLLGVIFIIYLNFSLGDFLIIATNQTSFLLKVILATIYLVFIYYFLKTFQFSNLKMKAVKKKKRIFSIMKLGLIYSFLINLLFKVIYSYGTKIMNFDDLKSISDKVVIIEDIASHPGDTIIDLTGVLNSVLVTEFVIMPELIIFWTVQMFFIAVVLEFFLQQEKVIEK